MNARRFSLCFVCALLLAGLLVSGARAGDGPRDDADAPARPTKTEAVPTLTRTQWRLGKETVSGFELATTEANEKVVATADGALRRFPAAARPDVVSTSDAPVTDVPPLALAQGLADEAERVRDRCEELLRQQKDAALPGLAVALESPNSEARWRALCVLSKVPQKKLLSGVRDHLADPEPRVRQKALRAYSLLAPDDLQEKTVWMLKHDGSVEVEHEALVQLGRCHELTAVDAVLDHLATCQVRNLRLVAFDALRRLTGQRFGRDEEQWRAWWTNHREEVLKGGDGTPGPRRKGVRSSS
jgi:hypothetical protein